MKRTITISIICSTDETSRVLWEGLYDFQKHLDNMSGYYPGNEFSASVVETEEDDDEK